MYRQWGAYPMRAAIIFGLLAAVPFLAACGSGDGDWIQNNRGFAVAPVSDRHQVTVEDRSERFCARMAAERASDIDHQGLDEGDDGLHQRVYDKTYADCITWQHRAVVDTRAEGGMTF
jgi:hypothetical protein